jgi:hypothetical protein
VQVCVLRAKHILLIFQLKYNRYCNRVYGLAVDIMDSSIPKPVSWQVASRRVSSCDSMCSLPPSAPSSEQCALMNFAYRLGSIVKNNDPSTVDNVDVRREAKLLMSLSYPSWEVIQEDTTRTNTTNSGRITPPSSDATSSSSSSRDSFCFTCPSLSLDHKTEDEGVAPTTRGEKTNKGDDFICPATMLGRTLKVGDRDAMRLSSDAMARNIMQSFQKAMQWRIHGWVTSLARVLVLKEMDLKRQGASDEMIQELLRCNEALLVAALRQVASTIQVLEASTSFKVMHKLPTLSDSMDSPALKKSRFDEKDHCGLQEGEYAYDVTHLLEMQTALKVSTPAGNIHIDLNVPGIMKGTFLSSEQDYQEELTDVNLQLNTTMLATMIDKSSRIAVRASAEALLAGVFPVNARTVASEHSEIVPGSEQEDLAESPAPATASEWAAQTSTPKRKFSDDVNPVPGLMVITPRDASSPSSYGESDSDGDQSTSKPVCLQIPDNFSHKKSGPVIYPQPSRARDSGNRAIGARLPPKHSPAPTAVVTPLNTAAPRYEYREKGPNLPVLVEVACAAIAGKK